MKNLSKETIRKLGMVKEAMLANPTQVGMDNYFSDINSLNRPAGGCGTAGCIAGFAIAIFEHNGNLSRAGSLSNRKANEHIRARDILGLEESEANALFYLQWWPTAYRLTFRRTDTEADAARAVARRIDHFIKTDGRK